MDAVKEYEDHIASLCKLDYEKLTTLYSPSAWVKRMPKDEVIDDHFQNLTQASIKTRAELVCSHRIAYGPSEAQKLETVSGPSTEQDAPIFLYIHGGYWQAFSIECALFMASPLVEAGAKVVAIGYDLAPEASMDVILEQIKEAIVHVVQMAVKTNSRGVYFGGHSAGAHLAVRALDSSLKNMLSAISEDAASMIKGAFLVGGIYDLRPLVFTEENEILYMTEESAWHLSPMNPKNIQQLTSLWHHVNFIVIICENDSPEFRNQAKNFHQFLQASKEGLSKFVDLPELDHFSMAEQLMDRNTVLTKELIDLMQLNEPNKSKGATTQGSSHM